MPGIVAPMEDRPDSSAKRRPARPGGKRGWGGPRRRGVRRWLGAVLAPCLLFSCAQAATEVEELTGSTVSGRVRVFLVAPGDDGQAGRRVGCGDSLVPVEVNLPRPAPALEGAIGALLSLRDRNDPKSGLYNPLYASRLTVTSVQRAGAQVRVDLTGYLELGGECDDPRILAQLEETALQFPDVEHVRFYLDGKLLQQLVSGRG
jgi:hypothetical protein